MPKQKVVFVFLALLLVLQLLGCEKSSTPTPTPDLAPLEIASRAADAMLDVNGLHFTIIREGALAYIDTDKLLAFKRAEGDFVQPNQLRAIVRVITAFTPVEIGMIVLGAEQYATDPITGEWGLLPPEWGQFNLAALFDPQTGLRGLLRDGILDLSLAGSQEIQGQDHYHLVGRASGERMRTMTMGFIGVGDVELEVWIGAQDFYVRRLYIVEPETDPQDPTTWDLEFSNLGQPVEIEAPPISSS